MGNVKGITIELGFDNKSQRKLKAIAKHAGALADELEEIDNAVECPYCGSIDVTTQSLVGDDEVKTSYHECEQCHRTFNDELPTHHEGSE